ncbi:hypothetical protein [Micromonospora aurantiaca (nom. illeg.)]|uniref:hypothetical protein n=1 Tax=Micromonospora aurantiaca (nom. illeg.) TaxID=47850 RepID=UPI003F4A6E31
MDITIEIGTNALVAIAVTAFWAGIVLTTWLKTRRPASDDAAEDPDRAGRR